MAGAGPNPQKTALIRLLLFTGLLITVLIFTGLQAVRYFEVGELPLPDLIGLDAEHATQLLAAENLEAITYTETSSGAAAGAVTSQTPVAGTIVRRGRTVSLGVHAPAQNAPAPQLTGLTLEQAFRTALNENLTIDRIDYEHDDAAEDVIIGQDPAPGITIDAAAGLSVLVSRGPELPPVAMPDVRGLVLHEARQRLGGLGFTAVQQAATGTSFDQPGTVTAQQPVAGTVVPRSSPVMLSYALAATEVVQVPAVAGQSPQRVQMLLRSVGLQVGPIEYVDEPGEPAGVVVRTEPSAYTLRGTPVRLVINGSAATVPVALDPLAGRLDPPLAPQPEVSLFPEGEFGSRQVPVTFDPQHVGSNALLERPYSLRFVVDDERGERTVLERTVPAGESVSSVIVVYGDALLQTYINDIFFQAWRP